MGFRVYLKGPLVISRTGEANGTGVPLPITQNENIDQARRERPRTILPMLNDTSTILGKLRLTYLPKK